MGYPLADIVEKAIVALSWLTVVTLAILFAVPGGRRRRRKVRLRVLARVLLPRRLLRSASGRADIGFMLFALFFAGAAMGWALFSSLRVEAALYAALLDHGLRPAVAAAPPFLCAAIATVALYVAYEFAYWMNHWLCHRIGWLWAFHKVHHTAESLSPLTNFRVHPVDTIVFYNMVALVTGTTAALLHLVLGDHAGPFTAGGSNALIFVSSTILANLQHTHLWISLPGRWGRILMSPAHHQLHHSIDPRHHNRNFGASLALFDRLFGTLHRPAARREPLRFGVDAAGRDPHGPLGAVLIPFADAATSLTLPAFHARPSAPSAHA